MAAEPKAIGDGIQLVKDPVQLKGLEPEYHDVVVVGGGLSGVGIACNLKKELNVTDVVVVERHAGPAGTWETNTYPGCACDIPAPVYSYSFRQRNNWSSMYPGQEELREYVHTVVSEFGLWDCFRFNSVAREARYDDTTGLWHVVTEQVADPKKPNAKPVRSYYVCKMLYMAVGGLSEPNPCTIPGKENFKGAIFHSARWDHSVDLKNKNVIVVGNGCSATQFVPIVAEQAKKTTQFVRSKHWYAPQPKIPLDNDAWKWMVRHFTICMYINRFLIWLVLESHFAMALLNPIGDWMRASWEKLCRDHVHKLAPKKYWDQLLPDKEELLVSCRRRILDNVYLPALYRDDLELETSKLVKIEEDAVITEDGRRIPADVIVMANGFNPQTAGFPLQVRGRDMTLQEHYKKYGEGGIVAYRSTLNAGFPNMFFLVGPNSGTGHMSVIFTSERQQELSLRVGKPILQAPRPSEAAVHHLPGTPADPSIKKIPTFEVKLQAELDEQHWITKRMSQLVFPYCDSWYRDSNSGRVTAVHPDWQWRYALRCWFPVWRDLIYTGLPDGKKHPDRSVIQVIGNALGLGESPYVDPSETPQIDRKAMGA